MSLAYARTARQSRKVAAGSFLSRHRPLILVELVLLGGTLALAAIVKAHPGPLPGDWSITVGLQHLVLPDHLLRVVLDFISTVTWPAYVFFQIGILIAIMGVFRRVLDIALTLMVAGAADGSNWIISQFDRRPRPTGAGLYIQQHITQYFSFPSGHVEHVVAFLGIIVFLTFQVRRPLAWLWIVRLILIATVVLMGPARLAEGEHWPSDVLAGLLLGGFWFVLGMHVYAGTATRWPRLVPHNERKDWSCSHGAAPSRESRSAQEGA